MSIQALPSSADQAPAPPLEGGDDDAAFERLHADYRPFVERVVRRYLWGAVVDDTVQETFVQAYRSRLHLRRAEDGDGGDGGDRRTAKRLAAIARNRSIDVLRKRMRGLEEVADDGRLVSVAASAPEADPEVHLLAARRREGIADAVDTLCERQRRVLLLRHVAGHPYEEIARLEGITIDAVKATLARGRRAFRHTYAAIAERRGLSVLPGFGLLRRLAARLRWVRDRALSGANEALGTFAAASPAITQGVVAAVVVGSVAVVGAGLDPSPAAADPASHRSEAPAGSGDADSDGAEGHGDRDDAAPESGGESAEGGSERSGERGAPPGPDAAPVAADPEPVSHEASASADSDEVAPGGGDSQASARAESTTKAEADADDDSGTASGDQQSTVEAASGLSWTGSETDQRVGHETGCIDSGKEGPVKDAVCAVTNSDAEATDSVAGDDSGEGSGDGDGADSGDSGDGSDDGDGGAPDASGGTPEDDPAL